MLDNWDKNADKLIKVLQKLMIVGNFNRKKPIVISIIVVGIAWL